ncbi:MAG TPA: hypothetical protein VM097_01760 [Mycobacteriales bacterium]|nr:hypothetical protein [Mycobacteriales bacterium]
MSTYSFEQLGPVLVSELPPVGPLRPGLVSRLCTVAKHRSEERRFERALRVAAPGEHSDLIAAARRG